MTAPGDDGVDPAMRPRTGVTLDTPLAEVLGPELGARLASALDLQTVADLLYHVPLRYRSPTAESDRPGYEHGERVTVVGRVASSSVRQARSTGKDYLTLGIAVEDAVGTAMEVTFFSVGKLPFLLSRGTRVMFDGTVKLFRGKVSLSHPEFLVLGAGALVGSSDLRQLVRLSKELEAAGEPDLFGRPLVPIYPASRKVTSWEVFGAVVEVLRRLDPVPDPLDPALRSSAGVVGLDTALRELHTPATERQHRDALRRLRFDEALVLQLHLVRRRRLAALDPAPACPPVAGRARDGLAEALPFDLTDGQRAVVDEMTADLALPTPMSRLLQGEVGSGKTVVALLAMLQVVDTGRQTVLLAPTEVLAAQHHRSLTRMLGPLAEAGTLGAPESATRVVLLTGSMSTAERRRALLDIVSGDAGIVVGTHAVIQDRVDFFDLALVVVDEQHRFGVRQRDRLRERGRDGLVPHMLVMTATPIPRTVALTMFGDLAVSELRELPAGRSPITTSVVALPERRNWYDRVWERVREEAARGRRTYVVCSRIGDGEGEDQGTYAPVEPGDAYAPFWNPGAGADEGLEPPLTVSAVQVHRTLSAEILPDLRVGLVHGRLPADDKDAAMSAFTGGEVDVLVATTVVEVGVDVPEATVMVIMDADRYGVSQLHQLRGRVGRGGLPGVCLLVTRSRSRTARARLDAVAATTDGFALARLDLEQRREGNILGDAQSGRWPQLRILSVVDDGPLIDLAREHAEAVLDSDPGLGEHPGLATRLDRLTGGDDLAYLDRS